MLYKKPKDMKYTDMCIYIDKNAYREGLTEEEENIIFQYLFHISFMLANGAKLFNNYKTYEDFAVYMATRMYMRLRNPKQYVYNEDGEPKLTKIRSILNHAKSILPWAKIEFMQQNYSQILSYNADEDDVDYSYDYNMSKLLSDSVDQLVDIDFNSCLGDIISTIRYFMSKIPYSTDEERLNLYNSCILTFINSITLSDAEYNRFLTINDKAYNHDSSIYRLYDKHKNDVVLYHLDDDMANYIFILVKELKHLIAKDLSVTLHTYVPTSSAYAMSEINSEDYRYEQ